MRRCDHCGMAHRKGENTLCIGGPFVKLEEHERAIANLKLEGMYILNEFKSLLQKQPHFPSQAQEAALDRAERAFRD